MDRYALLRLQLFDTARTRRLGPLRHDHGRMYFRPLGDLGGGAFSAALWQLERDGEQLWEWRLHPGERAMFGAEFALAEFAAQLSIGAMLEMLPPGEPIGSAEVLALGPSVHDAFIAWAHRLD